jgi:hypothetical protein
MTWLLVIVMMHADGSTTDARAAGFLSADACFRAGQAWAAQMVRREETLTLDIRCKEKG